MTINYGLGNYVKSVSRFDGTAVSNTFNSAGLRSSVKYPDSTLNFSYLKNNLLTTAANEACTVSNGWDFANRLTDVKVTGLVSTPLSLSYGYYPAGNLSNMTSVAGTLTLTHDEAERVSSISATRPGLSPLAFNLTYDGTNGLVSYLTCTNTGVTVSYDWDDWDRLTGILWKNASNNVIRNFQYSFNSAGMITGCGLSGEGIGYAYDDLDRLVGETRTDSLGQTIFSETVGYDEVGNRTSKTRDGIAVSYSYGTGNNRLIGWAITQTNLIAQMDLYGSANESISPNSHWGQLWVSNSFQKLTPNISGTNFWVYDMGFNLGTQKVVAAIRDAAGNTTFVTNQVYLSVVTNGAYLHSSAGCVTNVSYSGSGFSQNIGLSWNSQYQLTEVKTNGASVERNGFDALGRRVWNWDGTTTNYFVYDGQQIIADVDSTGGLRRAYVHGPGIDNWLAMTVYTGATAKTYFYLTDRLGTVHAVVDETGTIVESYRFDAWGRVLGVYDGSGMPLTESAIGNKILWQGREYSWKTGFYYFRARWYDPVTGRWLSNDPAGISGGLDQYVFCNNNPVNFRDPNGLCTEGQPATTLNTLPNYTSVNNSLPTLISQVVPGINAPPVPVPVGGPGAGWRWTGPPPRSSASRRPRLFARMSSRSRA
jgi:RHS repeat-associated protein